jgi:16S rRNA processing protein RimM
LDISEKNLIVVAKIGAPYGVEGWLKLTSYTSPKNNIVDYSSLYISKSGSIVPLTCEDMRVFKNDKIILKITAVDNPESAREYTNCIIYLPREHLPPVDSGSYYWHDLVGLRVRNTAGIELGVVNSLFATGANDVVVVSCAGKKDLLLPYVKQVVIEVDLAAATMLVDWEPCE